MMGEETERPSPGAGIGLPSLLVHVHHRNVGVDLGK